MMVSNSRRSNAWLAAERFATLAAVLFLLTGGAWAAGREELRRHPGYVDPEPFLDLADEDGSLVEISIPGTLLKAFSTPFESAEPDLADLVGGLEWVGAVIVETEDPDRIARAKKLFASTEKRLLDNGWERLARVQEEGATVKVLILNTEKTISGLVVMVRDEGELVFTNIAGIIDLEKLGALGRKMEIPGLEEIGND